MGGAAACVSTTSRSRHREIRVTESAIEEPTHMTRTTGVPAVPLEGKMTKTIASMAALATIVLASVASGAPHHIKAALDEVNASGVTGFIQITQQPHGGANLHVVAAGLTPGAVYASFYYESSDCTEPADLLGVFTGKPGGVAAIHGKIDEDLDEVGSVSVRVGPDYGDLLACASLR